MIRFIAARKLWLITFGALLVIALAAGIAMLQIRSALPVLAPYTPPKTIIVDPGHGGADGGAVGVDGVVEKEINLAIAKKLQELLVLSGFDVIMTREEDIAIHDPGVTGLRNQKISDLQNRLRMIEQNPEAIFISVHQNMFTQSKYSGAQMFYGKLSEQSEVLANTMQAAFCEKLQPENKRVHKPAGKNLYLLYNAQVPAVMVECGFLSNSAEARKLQEESYQHSVAFVIYGSILQYMSDSGAPKG